MIELLWKEHQAVRGKNMRSLSLPNITTMLTNEIVEARRQSEPDNLNELTEESFPRKFSYFDILSVNTFASSSPVNKVSLS